MRHPRRQPAHRLEPLRLLELLLGRAQRRLLLAPVRGVADDGDNHGLGVQDDAPRVDLHGEARAVLPDVLGLEPEVILPRDTAEKAIDVGPRLRHAQVAHVPADQVGPLVAVRLDGAPVRLGDAAVERQVQDDVVGVVHQLGVAGVAARERLARPRAVVSHDPVAEPHERQQDGRSRHGRAHEPCPEVGVGFPLVDLHDEAPGRAPDATHGRQHRHVPVVRERALRRIGHEQLRRGQIPRRHWKPPERAQRLAQPHRAEKDHVGSVTRHEQALDRLRRERLPGEQRVEVLLRIDGEHHQAAAGFVPPCGRDERREQQPDAALVRHEAAEGAGARRERVGGRQVRRVEIGGPRRAHEDPVAADDPDADVVVGVDRRVQQIAQLGLRALLAGERQRTARPLVGQIADRRVVPDDVRVAPPLPDPGLDRDLAVGGHAGERRHPPLGHGGPLLRRVPPARPHDDRRGRHEGEHAHQAGGSDRTGTAHGVDLPSEADPVERRRGPGGATSSFRTSPSVPDDHR